jgi:hypothetical protein
MGQTRMTASSLAWDYKATSQEIERAYYHARQQGYSEYDAWVAVKTWLMQCRGQRRAK